MTGNVDVYCDGSGAGPDSLGAISLLIVKDKYIIHQESILLDGRADKRNELTNNEAEYTAVIEAARLLAPSCNKLSIEVGQQLSGCDHITIHSDSQLVVNQCTGRYQIHEHRLQQLHDLLEHDTDGFLHNIRMKWSIVWEPRDNMYIKQADKLNRATIRKARLRYFPEG